MGYKNYVKIDTTQNQAIRLYLGDYAFAPNLAINADMKKHKKECRNDYISELADSSRIKLTYKTNVMWNMNINKKNWCGMLYR